MNILNNDLSKPEDILSCFQFHNQQNNSLFGCEGMKLHLLIRYVRFVFRIHIAPMCLVFLMQFKSPRS